MKRKLLALTIISALALGSCGRKDVAQTDPKVKKKGYHKSGYNGYLRNGKKDGNEPLSGY